MSEIQCECVLVIGFHMHIDRRNCPIHSPNARPAWPKSQMSKPLCHQDPCNDPECRLDHDQQD